MMESLQTLLFIPLVVALVVRLLARQPRLASAAGTVAVGGLWLWLRGVEPGSAAVVLWGQPLLLTAVTHALLLLLLGGLFILFTLSIFFASGEWFVPAGLMSFSFLAGSLLSQSFSIAITLVLLAAGLLTFIIQSGQAGSVRGSLRYLLSVLLAVTLLLLVNGQLMAQPDSRLLPLGQLTALAILLLLAGFPFQVWLQAIVEKTRPLPLALAVGLAPIVPLRLFYQLIHIFPNLLDASFQQLIWLSGSLSLLVAGILAVTAVHFKRLIGSVLLLDMALTVLSLTLPLQIGWETAVSLQIGRFGSLLLLACGWELLQKHQRSWPLDKFPAGLGWRSPVGVALLGLGLFSLLGLPFTLGFSGHWRLLTVAAELANRAVIPWWLPALALLSLGLGAAAVFRALLTLLAAPQNEEAIARRDPIWLQAMVGIILLVATWLALFPQTIAGLVEQLQGF